MFQFIRNWLDSRIIQRSTVTPEEWADAYASLPLLKGLPDDEMRFLKNLAILFLDQKIFEGAHGLEVTRSMRLIIALQACLLLLKLDTRRYHGWVTVIVYPEGFAPKQVIRDEYGVEHHTQSTLAGQAWLRGPVILAWDETMNSGDLDGDNVVIHEFAHKLDMRNGVANGFPTLPSGMDAKEWAAIFSAGFEDFQDRCARGNDIGIDCYAATSPAEFFAVLSEVFFEHPAILNKQYAAIYDQLRLYYRQDPLVRLG